MFYFFQLQALIVRLFDCFKKPKGTLNIKQAYYIAHIINAIQISVVIHQTEDHALRVNQHGGSLAMETLFACTESSITGLIFLSCVSRYC